MLAIINSILPVFLLIALGVIIKIIQNHEKKGWKKFLTKIKHEDDNWSEVLNKFALYISLPALIFSSLINTNPENLIREEVLFANIILIILFILTVFAITKVWHVDKKLANTYIMCGFFGNIAYIGLPFITSLFPDAAGATSIIIAIHIVIAFTLGLYILESSKSKDVGVKTIIKSIVKNPMIISVALGLGILYSGITVPGTINRAVSMLAASASPVVLISIGLFIARKISWDKTLMHAFFISGLKILVLPMLFLLASRLSNISSEYTISIIEAGMPVALTNFALSELYPMDKKLTAKSIIVSTILSLLTLSIFSGLTL